MNTSAVTLTDVTAEGLRLSLSAGVDVGALLPHVLDLLERRPLLTGGLFPGDLLAATLRVGDEAWLSAPQERARMTQLLIDAHRWEAPIAALRERFLQRFDA